MLAIKTQLAHPPPLRQSVIPFAIVALRRQPVRRTKFFLVLNCPFCAGEHLHGAGRVDENPSDYQGSRYSHCANGKYLLRWNGTETD
jgi:hypothetical protein